MEPVMGKVMAAFDINCCGRRALIEQGLGAS
jgi:hypothetical protein